MRPYDLAAAKLNSNIMNNPHRSLRVNFYGKKPESAEYSYLSSGLKFDYFWWMPVNSVLNMVSARYTSVDGREAS